MCKGSSPNIKVFVPSIVSQKPLKIKDADSFTDKNGFKVFNTQLTFEISLTDPKVIEYTEKTMMVIKCVD